MSEIIKPKFNTVTINIKIEDKLYEIKGTSLI